MTVESDMPITAILPWYGSKRSLAPRIVAELGPHRAYWEPFCGSLAVLLAKPAASLETVNDLHPDLIHLARCLQDRRVGPSLYRRLRRAWNSEELFRESRDACLSPPAKGHGGAGGSGRSRSCPPTGSICAPVSRTPRAS